MDLQGLREQLILDEGLRLLPYTDTVGKLTIGVGRNLADGGITRDEAMYLLDNDIKLAVNRLDDSLAWWRTLSDVRQNVLLNMCFNMGLNRLLGFKKALAAMQAGNFEEAANEMQSSAWSNQVGPRAQRLVQSMRSGK